MCVISQSNKRSVESTARFDIAVGIGAAQPIRPSWDNHLLERVLIKCKLGCRFSNRPAKASAV